jgi:cell division protein FtsA
MVEEDETIEVASVGGRRPRVMARRILSDILQPRAEEMFHLIWDEISKAGYEKSLNSGLVLTGGGAQLEGMSEIAEQIFDLPIRRGVPVGVGGLADHVSNPGFATAVGLVLYAARHRGPSTSITGGGALTRVDGPPQDGVQGILLEAASVQKSSTGSKSSRVDGQ